MQGSLSIERMCQLAQVSRAGFYRSLAEQKPREEEMEVRAAIQRVALDIGGAMATAGSRPSCAARACCSIISAWRGSCAKTICWRCDRSPS